MSRSTICCRWPASALVKAIDRYDADRGTAFSSFAVPTILGELKRYFRDLGWAVHVPRGAQELAVKVEEVNHRLTARDGRAPSVQALAQYMELPVEDVLDALETARAHHAASLDAPHDDGEGDGGGAGRNVRAAGSNAWSAPTTG